LAITCHLRRGICLALLAATDFVSATPSITAAEFELVASRAAAVTQARQQGKLLLAIDLSGDFLAGDAQSPEVKLYRALALADPRVAELLAARFVVTFRHVGQSVDLQVIAGKDERNAPLGDYALAFVCIPGERVLHFIPGLVSAEELLRELAWSDALNRERLANSPADKEWLIRQRHLAAVPADDLKLFRESYDSQWREDFQAPAARSPAALLPAIRAARKERDQALLRRLKSNWPSQEDQQALLAAMAAHGGLEPALAHLLLAEFPLPKLAELEVPLYEIASGQRFWQAAAQPQDLLAWWTQVRRAGKRSVLVVNDDPFFATLTKGGDALAWPPLAPSIAADLRRFAWRVVTLDELAILAPEAGLGPYRFHAGEGPPRFLIHDARGFPIGEMSASEGTIIRLAQALNATLIAGDVALRAGAGGGP
jgi:hypothetical protein